MKKTAIALLLILALLFAVAAGTLSIGLASANPYIRDYVSPDGFTKPPNITVYSPENNSLCSNVSLSINVSLPQSSTAPFTFLHNVHYEADWLQNKTTLYNSASLADEIRSDKPPENQYFAYNGVLTGVPDGNHSLIIYAEGGGWYRPEGMKQSGFFIDGSLTVFFTVDSTPPRVTFLSLENKTYYESEISLKYTIDESVSLVMYSLDGKENVPLSENAQITGLAKGDHNVTVYSMDEAGNTGTQTIYFTITEPFPTVPVAAVLAALAAVS